MEVIKAFENIQTIQIQTPVDKIISQIKNLITTGQLKPGDRLPAERLLAERFGVGRGYIREAILKLEFYGLLKTSPQSGTYVSGFSLKILDSIFTDIINFNKDDFASLIEARYYMEINSARLAAERRTDNDIDLMKDALADYDEKTKKKQQVVQEDMLFHIRLAAASKNPVIESMIIILVPDLMKVIVEHDICHNERCQTSVLEHHKILKAVIRKDVNAAGKAMEEHLKAIMAMRASL
jgi:GntR family transcriptional repressor for pyruvate dehydrogenase complex